jgi:hypothetical protein
MSSAGDQLDAEELDWRERIYPLVMSRAYKTMPEDRLFMPMASADEVSSSHGEWQKRF